MSLPSWAWYGPDSPDKLLFYVEWASQRFPTVPEADRCLQVVAKHFGPTGKFCMVTGMYPARWLAGYAHILVGIRLDWHPGNVDGLGVHDMRREGFNPYERRGALVDDRNTRTPEALGLLVIKEMDRVLGLTDAEMHGRGRMAREIEGLAACAAAARKWRGD